MRRLPVLAALVAALPVSAAEPGSGSTKELVPVALHVVANEFVVPREPSGLGIPGLSAAWANSLGTGRAAVSDADGGITLTTGVTPTVASGILEISAYSDLGSLAIPDFGEALTGLVFTLSVSSNREACRPYAELRGRPNATSALLPGGSRFEVATGTPAPAVFSQMVSFVAGDVIEGLQLVSSFPGCSRPVTGFVRLEVRAVRSSRAR